MHSRGQSVRKQPISFQKRIVSQKRSKRFRSLSTNSIPGSQGHTLEQVSWDQPTDCPQQLTMNLPCVLAGVWFCSCR